LFCQHNNITELPKLQDKITEMRQQFNEVSEKLKANERRQKTLDKHIEQGGYYLECKGIYEKYLQQKPKHQEVFREAHRREITLYETAERYLNQHMNGHVFSVKTLKSWKSEQSTLTSDREPLYNKYTALREETQKVETIKRTVEAIIHEETQERQLSRSQGIEI
jgi:hypothetical protein